MTLDPVARVTDRGSTEFDISVRAQTADGAALLLGFLPRLLYHELFSTKKVR